MLWRRPVSCSLLGGKERGNRDGKLAVGRGRCHGVGYFLDGFGHELAAPLVIWQIAELMQLLLLSLLWKGGGGGVRRTVGRGTCTTSTITTSAAAAAPLHHC